MYAMMYDEDVAEMNATINETLEEMGSNSTGQPAPAALTTAVHQPKRLNEKAMTVKLTTGKPRTSFNDEEAASVAQSALGDAGITASTRLFKDKTNPIRSLLNEVDAIYHFHKKHTIPYEDRGPRLLPVGQYEAYRDEMRTMIAAVDSRIAAMRTDPSIYYRYVDNDIAFRNQPKTTITGQVVPSTRASRSDYPTAEEFCDSIALKFKFAPLPDNSHWLFDVDEEDRQALQDESQQIFNAAMGDLRGRIEKPLRKLLDVLKKPVDATNDDGKRTGIFRNTTITNVVDAVANVKALSMGEPGVLAACDTLTQVMAPIAANAQAVRDVPELRATAAKKLEEVAAKMGAFFNV